MTKPCARCGKDFEARGTTAKYCLDCRDVVQIERNRENVRRYYQSHKEQCKEYSRRYYAEHREQLREAYRQRERQKTIESLKKEAANE